MSTLCASLSQKSPSVRGRNAFRFTTAEVQIIILKVVILSLPQIQIEIIYLVAKPERVNVKC